MNNERSLAKEITEGFEALKSMRNNEPVAWMVDGVLFTSLGAALNISFDIEQPCIPLFTHPVKEQDESFDRTASHMAGEYVSYPVKELTDEEIKAIWHKVWHDEEGTILDFGRAILRKAQEK